MLTRGFLSVVVGVGACGACGFLQGADVHRADKSGRTPLSVAISRLSTPDDRSIMVALLNAGGELGAYALLFFCDFGCSFPCLTNFLLSTVEFVGPLDAMCVFESSR
jgi:hypothetical protein